LILMILTFTSGDCQALVGRVIDACAMAIS